jgi:hypothetical protein
MGKAIGVYIGLMRVYLFLIYKRGSIGIISLLAANILLIFTVDSIILKIIKFFCVLNIFSFFLIDYKNEKYLFKILNISSFSQKLVKGGIIITLGIFQWAIFLLFGNDKII